MRRTCWEPGTSFPPQLWWAQVHTLTAPGPTGIRPEHIPDLLSVLRRVHANKVHAAFSALCYRISTGTFRCTFGRTRLEKCRTYLRERVATKVIPLCRCSSISPCTRLSSAPEIFSEKVKNFSLFGRRVSHLQTREGVGGFPCDRKRTVDPLQDKRALRQDATLEPQWDHTQRMRGSHQSCPGPEPRTSRLARGPSIASRATGIVVLGSPVGHAEFIKAKLMSKVTEHQTLLERIPLVRDVLGFSCSFALPPGPTIGCERFGPI